MEAFFNSFSEWLCDGKFDIIGEKIVEIFLSYISRFSFLASSEYYSGLFQTYFSVGGFLIGLAFVVLIILSGLNPDEFKTHFFKVLSMVAVINCCVVIANYLEITFNQGFQYEGVEQLLNAPDNIISGFLLTLAICSCYRECGWRALTFGIITYLTPILLNFGNFGYFNNGMMILHVVLRTIIVGFLCMIISHRQYFYTSWIWYFGFHMFNRVGKYVLDFLGSMSESEDASVYVENYLPRALPEIADCFSRFIVDGIIFAVILTFAIVFEKKVLTQNYSHSFFQE